MKIFSGIGVGIASKHHQQDLSNRQARDNISDSNTDCAVHCKAAYAVRSVSYKVIS